MDWTRQTGTVLSRWETKILASMDAAYLGAWTKEAEKNRAAAQQADKDKPREYK